MKYVLILLSERRIKPPFSLSQASGGIANKFHRKDTIFAQFLQEMKNNFPTSLFDFDFSDCTPAIGKNYADNSAYENALRNAFTSKNRENTLAPRTNDLEELSERATALRKLADRAFEENRMDAYFRILDSIEAYPAECLNEPTPATYGIPEVRLTYVAESSLKTRPTIQSSKMLAEAFRNSFEAGEIEFREHFKIAYLDNRHRVLGIHTVGMGGLDVCPVDLRVIFTGALLAHSSRIALCHNHPSGGLIPSGPDDNLTRQIAAAGKILKIQVLDHIIITEESYYSYMDNGKM